VNGNAGYEQAYRNIKFERRGGCLLLSLHTDGDFAELPTSSDVSDWVRLALESVAILSQRT
jgi:hypothetical protein